MASMKSNDGQEPPFDGVEAEAPVGLNSEATPELQSNVSTSRAHHESFRHTRISAAWVAVTVAVIFGIALIVFIAQNTRHVHINFFMVSAQVPVAVALLAAALAGAIVVLAIGVGRVTQLRLNLRRQRRHLKNESQTLVRDVDREDGLAERDS